MRSMKKSVFFKSTVGDSDNQLSLEFTGWEMGQRYDSMILLLVFLKWTHILGEFKHVLESSRMPSLVAQLVKNLPAMQETQVRFLGQEKPLEKR